MKISDYYISIFATLSFHNSYNNMINDSHFSSTFYAAKCNIFDFINLINTADKSGGFSFLKDIHISNDKNNHLNAHKTWGYQIWTVDTPRGVDKFETY